MSRERGQMLRCQGEADGVRCARVAEYVGRHVDPYYLCESCSQGGKPYVPRDGRPGQQKQKRSS